MKAIVLVGGFGTRLRPLTLGRPKQMLPVLDRPMLEWAVERLVRAGVDEVVLSLGYRPDVFIDAYGDGLCCGARLRYAVEPEPLDTAGAIRFAALAAGLDTCAEPFFVVNGDVISDQDPAELLAMHYASKAQATILLTPVEDPSRYGVVSIAEDGSVLAFVEKPPPGEAPSNWINAGTYVLEPSVVGLIPGGRKVSIERETFPLLVDSGSLFALQAASYWIDAGTPSTYIDVQLDLVEQRHGLGASHIGVGASVAPSASVTRSVVMAGARVGAGAIIEGSVLLPDAVIGENCQVTGSIVGWGAVVEQGARLSELTVIGDGMRVNADSVLRGARVPDSDG